MSKYLPVLFCFFVVMESLAQVKDINLGISNADTALIMEQIQKGYQLRSNYPDSAATILEDALRDSRQIMFYRGISNASFSLSELYYRQKKWDLSLNNISVFKNNYPQFPIDLGLGLVNYYKGVINYHQGKYKESLDAYLEAAKHLPDTHHVKAGVYNNIGEVLSMLYEHEKALFYYDMSIKMAVSKQMYPLICGVYMNKGKVYTELRKFNEASIAYDSAIAYSERYQLRDEMIQALCFKAAMLNKQEKYNDALALIADTRSRIKDTAIYRAYLLNILAADAYQGLSDYKQAEEELVQARDLVQESSLVDLSYILHRLGEVYYATARYKEAYDMHLASHQISDSINNLEVSKQANELEVVYRTGEKDKIISKNKVIMDMQQQKLWISKLQLWGIASAAIILLLLLGMRYIYIHQKNRRLKSERQLETLRAIMEGEEQERKRLAHELHNGVNSQLAATHAYVEAAGKLYPKIAINDSLEHIRQMLSTTSHELRTIAHNLSPEDVLQEGIEKALRSFCISLFPDAGTTKVDIMTFGNLGHISKDKSLFLYRTAQELLHNVHKHALATEVIVQLGEVDDAITLTIEDNGVGFDSDEQETITHKGIGLSGTKERVLTNGGTMEVISGKQQGTSVSILLPK